MGDWTRADRWRTELARTASAVPIDLVAEFGVALLGELARRGTPHGALSPEAISVRREGSALRVRIDIAPTDPAQETLLATGTKSMSAHPGVHYRAPEQFTMDAFDARADCFAVGVMLYELASGQLPFGQGSTAPFKVFLALKRGGFPPLRDLRREVSETLVGVIGRSLALRPEERFDSVAAMASALRTLVRSPVPIAVSLPARVAPDRSGVPLDPLRPLETGVLPMATQAAIAAHRASEAQPRLRTEPSAPLPAASPPSRPITTPHFAPPTAPTQTVTPASSSPPREVPLPIRAIVEAVTRPEPTAPTPVSSPPAPRAAPPVRATPLSSPAVQPPIVLAPPTPAPPASAPPQPVVVRKIFVGDPPAPPAPPQRVGPRFGPWEDPARTSEPRSERTQVTGPPAFQPQAASRKPEARAIPTSAAPSEPSATASMILPALAPTPVVPRTLPPPSAQPQAASPKPQAPPVVAVSSPAPAPLPAARPTSEMSTVVAARPSLKADPPLVGTAPQAPTFVAPKTLPPPPPRRTAPVAAPSTPVPAPRPVEPVHIAPAAPSRIVEPLRMEAGPMPIGLPPAPPVQPEVRSQKPEVLPAPVRSPAVSGAPVVTPPTEPRSAPTVVAPAPLQQALLERATEPDAPVPPAEDTARRSAGEITPPEGNPKNPPGTPLRRKDAVIIGLVLLFLGAGAGLVVKLPSRVVKQASAEVCVPGPAMVCPPPPAPVAMPDPTLPAPVQCVPPKPSPKLTCFYDGLRNGQARYLRGDRSGALEAFQAAEQCMPRNPQLLKWIGRCHEELRDRSEARTYYERYLRRRPRADDADFYRTKVEALTRAPDAGTR